MAAVLAATLIPVGLATGQEQRRTSVRGAHSAHASTIAKKTRRSKVRRTGRVAVSLPHWRTSYDWSGGDGYVGWGHETAASEPAAYSADAPLGGKYGLWLWPTGDHEYRPGSIQWSYEAPGTTRIASAKLDVGYVSQLFAHHCADFALAARSGQRDGGSYCKPPEDPSGTHRVEATLTDPSSEPTSTSAIFRLRMPECHSPAPTPCSKWIPAHDPLVNGPFVRLHSIQLVLVDDDRPSVTASGPLRDLADHYINGQDRYGITVSARDPGAGIERLAVERLPSPELAADGAPCDPHHHTASLDGAVCPADASADMSVDTAALPEGKQELRAVATDPAENGGESKHWSVLVDRTPPNDVGAMDADLDDDARLATVSWDAADDPDLPDGIDGSGTSAYRYSWSRPNLAASPWEETADGQFDVPDAVEGEALVVSVQAIDEVGNAGGIRTQTVIVSADPGCELADVPDPVIDETQHAGIVTDDGLTDIKAYTFKEPVTKAELLDGMPSGADVVSAFERTDPVPGDLGHESQAGMGDGRSLRENLDTYRM